MEKKITVRQYADKYKISVNSVHKKIKSGKLKAIKENGKFLILIDSAATTIPAVSQLTQQQGIASNAERYNVELELRKQKLKNLRQDTILKKQKQQAQKERYRLQFAEGFLQVFTDSFQELKNWIIEAKLEKEKLITFQQTFKKCLKKLESGLKKHLKEADQKQEAIIQNENSKD